MAHERTMADETRKHSRIAEAYVEVLDMVAMMANFVSRIRPIIETDPAPPTPPMPPVGTQAHVDALMLAFASAEVLKLYESWRESVQATITADRQIEFLITLGQRGAPQGDDLTKLMRELGTELKPASETARKALVTGIAAELGSRI